jgi:large subunit ribosomal protein L15
MNLHSLRPAAGSNKKGKRIARGQGSGKGGTSTKGHKGAKARTGHNEKRHFEGGQMPLHMRLPKRGFKNVNRVEYVAFNLGRLQTYIEKYNFTEVSPAILYGAGLIKRTDLVKILATGELTSKINISAHAFSEKAKAAVEALGGQTTLIGEAKAAE